MKAESGVPAWAPHELMDEARRIQSVARVSPMNPLKSRPNWGGDWLSSEEELWLLEKLCAPEMKKVWQSLRKRRAQFDATKVRAPDEDEAHEIHPDHLEAIEYGVRRTSGSQENSLYCRCKETIGHWRIIPKRTRKETIKLYSKIASKALELAGLLAKCSEDPDMNDLISMEVVTEERIDEFCRRLESLHERGGDSCEGFSLPGFLITSYLRGVIPPPIAVLMGVKDQATYHAAYPLAVPQPNSKGAGLRFFIGEMSKYFIERYKQPLDEQVAIIASILFGVEVDKDADVRSLRIAKVRSSAKKFEKLKKKLLLNPEMPIKDLI